MRCFVVDKFVPVGSGPGVQRKDAAAEYVGRVSLTWPGKFCSVYKDMPLKPAVQAFELCTATQLPCMQPRCSFIRVPVF